MTKYYSKAEMIKNKDIIGKDLNNTSSYFTRKGIVLEYIQRYSEISDEIVEIGAGAGELASKLIELGYNNLSLIDFDDYLLENIDKSMFKKLDVSCEKLPFSSNSLDMVLAIAIIEHLQNPLFFIEETLRVLKDHGKFIVALPWIFSLRSKLSFLKNGDLMGYNIHNNHISIFTKSLFKKHFLSDYKIVDCKYSTPYIKFLKRKIVLPGNKFSFIDRNFSNKVLYVFKKK